MTTYVVTILRHFKKLINIDDIYILTIEKKVLISMLIMQQKRKVFRHDKNICFQKNRSNYVYCINVYLLIDILKIITFYIENMEDSSSSKFCAEEKVRLVYPYKSH
jgi:hypothetical protein